MVSASAPLDADLLVELGRRLRAVEALLGGLAADMAAAGAQTASERAERALAELRLAGEIATELRRRGGGVGR